MSITINGNGTVTGISAGGLPAGCVTSATLASGTGGQILQVVHGSTTTLVDHTNNTMTDIGLSASITPSSSSNKILVFGNIGGVESGGDNYGGGRLLRDSTSIIPDIDVGLCYTNDSTKTGTNSSFAILDSPGDTNSHTYKIQFRRAGGSSNITTQTNNSRSAITLMEIAV